MSGSTTSKRLSVSHEATPSVISITRAGQTLSLRFFMVCLLS